MKMILTAALMLATAGVAHAETTQPQNMAMALGMVNAAVCDWSIDYAKFEIYQIALDTTGENEKFFLVGEAAAIAAGVESEELCTQARKTAKLLKLMK